MHSRSHQTADMSRTTETGARTELEDQEGCPLPATDAALSLRSYPFDLRASETVGSDEDVVISAFHLYFWSPVTVTHCFLVGEKNNKTKQKLFRECNAFRAWYQLKGSFRVGGDIKQLSAVSSE